MSKKGICLTGHGSYRYRGEDLGCPFCRLRDEWAEVSREFKVICEDFCKALIQLGKQMRRAGKKWE